ncbi:MAG TPA: hypothetical protein VJ719_10460 [Chthoniobacterales bacterium]|nr:hypothetical protein [Chthoniobacterales bacterium]
MISKSTLAAIAAVSLLPILAYGGAVVRSASGSAPADIQATVDQFRTDISAGGGVNAPGTGPFATGRREINWDGVPDTVADPNLFPADFFNNNSKRGLVLSTAGTSLYVSADNSNPTSTPVRFGSVNPNYVTNFQTFSAERLFTALGSNVVDVSFFEPVNPTAEATTNGFGAVFTDVEIAGSTTIEYFDAQGQSLGVFAVPVSPNGGLSFLGVSFDAGEQISGVRITSGNTVLGPTNNDTPSADVVVMDDFIYGEPFQDADNDNVPDSLDDCLSSDVRPKVDVNGMQPGVTSIDNSVNPNGCTIQDLVNGCAAGVRNHGQYVSCITHLANDLRRAGTITKGQSKELKTGAARSKIGKKGGR